MKDDIKVGDYVKLTETGPGYKVTIRGRVTEIDARYITIGEGFGTDLDGGKLRRCKKRAR